jgi:hypothetical protein
MRRAIVVRLRLRLQVYIIIAETFNSNKLVNITDLCE